MGNLGFFYIANSIIISQDNLLVFSLPDVGFAGGKDRQNILFFDLQEADPDILPKTGLFVQARIRKTEEHGA